jgi:hypothetical protein
VLVHCEASKEGKISTTVKLAFYYGRGSLSILKIILDIESAMIKSEIWHKKSTFSFIELYRF